MFHCNRVDLHLGTDELTDDIYDRPLWNFNASIIFLYNGLIFIPLMKRVWRNKPVF